ncbi:MAG: FAD:protein FMN transferase [Polyangiaceae bacterium]
MKRRPAFVLASLLGLASVGLGLRLANKNSNATSGSNSNATSGSNSNASSRSVEPPSPSTEIVRIERPSMGTEVQMVSYVSREHSRLEITRAMEAAYVEIARLSGLLSSWTHTSDVGRVNDAEGRWISISEETSEVLERALWTSRVSEGAFDVTFAILDELWRFGDAAESPPRIPEPQVVAQRRAFVDYRRLEFRSGERAVRLPKGMRMSLDGIAKGYIVDRAARVLTSRGIESFFVRAGGDCECRAKARWQGVVCGCSRSPRLFGHRFCDLGLQRSCLLDCGRLRASLRRRWPSLSPCPRSSLGLSRDGLQERHRVGTRCAHGRRPRRRRLPFSAPNMASRSSKPPLTSAPSSSTPTIACTSASVSAVD